MGKKGKRGNQRGNQQRVQQQARGSHIAQASNGGASIVNTTNINLDKVDTDRQRLLHQLPDPVPDFIGRTAEIAQIVQALSAPTSSGATTLICGMGGAGKTQLAYAVAQRLTEHFPDAQLIVDLHGADERSLTPVQALQRVVQSLEAQAQTSDDLATLEASYRSLLRGKRALIIADDARNADQVASLTPPAGCALLITSRNRFVLPGITIVNVGMLADEEAITLLLCICPRIGEAASSLAERCGYLPLALRVSASLLQSSPTISVARHLEALQDVRARLAELREPGDRLLDIEASLNLSYVALSEEEQTALRQLSIFPSSFDLVAAKEVVSLNAASAKSKEQQRLATLGAEALGMTPQLLEVARTFGLSVLKEGIQLTVIRPTEPVEPTQHADALTAPPRRGRVAPRSLEQVLDSLYRRSLLSYDTAIERYKLHDLIRAFAAARLTAKEIKQLNRYAHHYLGVLHLCGALYYTGSEQMVKGLALFDRERGHIEAGWSWALSQADDALQVDYAVELSAFDDLRFHMRRDVLPRTEVALKAAQRLRRRIQEAVLLDAYGSALRLAGQAREAIEYHQRALQIARAIHNRFREGAALSSLGAAHAELGQVRQAIALHEQSLVIAREQGDHASEETRLGHLGVSYTNLGQPRQAITLLEQSLATAQFVGDRRGEGASLGNLGRAYLDLGETEQAIALCAQSLQVFQELGARQYEVYALNYLALAYATAGQLKRAEALQEEALSLSRAVADPRIEAQILIDIGKSKRGQDDIESAIEHFTQALALAQRAELQIETARANWNLGLACEQQGDLAAALPLLQARVDYERDIGHAKADEHAAYVAGVEARLSSGDGGSDVRNG